MNLSIYLSSSTQLLTRNFTSSTRKCLKMRRPFSFQIMAYNMDELDIFMIS
jgi:hypothetical protein